MENNVKQKKGYYYVVIVVMGLIMMFVGTQTSAGFGLMVNGIRDSVGLTGTQASTLFAIKNFSAFIFVFLATKYYAKLGLRLGVSLAFVYGIIAMIIFSVAGSNYILLCIASVILGTAYAFTMILPMALLIRTWFNKNRALAMSVCSAGTGLSTFILSPILQRSINERGLSSAFIILAIVFAVAGVVFFLFVRNKPEDVGLEICGGENYVEKQKDGAKPKVVVKKTSNQAVLGFTACALLMGLIAAPSQSHFVMHFNTLGFDSILVASAYSLLGLTLLIAKPTVGVLSTKIPFGPLSCTFTAIFVVAFGAAFLAGGMGLVPWIPFFVCIAFGIAGPFTSLGFTNWIADFSTKDDYPKKVKNAQFAYQGAEIVGALIPGMIMDRTGQYSGWYAIAAVAGVLIVLIVARMYISRTKLLQPVEE